MLVAQNSLGPVCPVPLTVRGTAAQRKGLGARLDSLTNLAALKEECRAHGLPASGTKAKLSQRLRDYASGVEPSKGKRRRGA